MVVYDIVWKDGEDQEGRGRWRKVGNLFVREDGRMSIKLDVIPVGPNWTGWLNVFEKGGEEDVPF